MFFFFLFSFRDLCVEFLSDLLRIDLTVTPFPTLVLCSKIHKNLERQTVGLCPIGWFQGLVGVISRCRRTFECVCVRVCKCLWPLQQRAVQICFMLLLLLLYFYRLLT